MPFELHADYDRDGRLTATAAEYAKRMVAPGAIILPNLDRDGRALPTKVESGSPIEPDWHRPSAVAQDKEPVPIRVVITAPDNPADCVLFLRGIGALGDLIRVRDSKLRLIPINPNGRAMDFIVPVAGSSADLFVETITVGGTPRSSLPTDPNPRRLILQLFCQRPGKNPVVVDSGIFEVPPVLVMDDLAPAERLYIAQADREENVPSLRDVEREIQGTGVPMIVIPESENFKDVWVQDQFQVAFCETPAGPLRILIHCPRVRANAYWVEKSLNLASVVKSHFPSTNLGVFDDLIERTFPLRDVAGTLHSLPLIESQHAYHEMGTVFRYNRTLRELTSFFAGKLKDPKPTRAALAALELAGAGLAAAHAQTGEVVKLLDKVIGLLKKEKSDPDLLAQLDIRAAGAHTWKKLADGAAPAKRPDVIEIPLSSNQRIEITAKAADELLDKLDFAHDTLTYGGNIECSPPFGTAKRGKVVIGTAAADTPGAIDPDVLRFFVSQDMPIVELDSTWLQVGHIDEFMGFVASPKSPTGFVIARAAPKLGVDLIDTCCRLYLSGLAAGHLHNVFGGDGIIFPRLTNDGPHPVTMMLRGMNWLHVHPKSAFEPVEPPSFFKDLSLYAHFGLFEPDWDKDSDRFVPGPLEESMNFPEGKRKYSARMSVLEWKFVDDGTNEDIEAQILTPLDADLATAFPDVPLLKLPVLFDRVPKVSTPDDKGVFKRNVSRTVKAFLPDSVNFQTVGDRILVPRPYAPRMSPADIALVLKAVFEANKIKGKLPELSESYFKKRGLLNTTVWLNSELDWHLAGKLGQQTYITRWFRDGFPKGMKTAEIFRLVQKANPGSFARDGELRPGWQRLTIPDGMVDVFEAAIQVQFESVGASPRFVDSWFYHTHSGQIHCGTNVLRKPRPAPNAKAK